MSSKPVWLTTLAWLLSGQVAAACDLADANADASPLYTRKPVAGEEVWLTSGFGVRFHPLLKTRKLHTGVDWATPIGTPVLAAGAGRIVSARVEGEFGQTIRIDHGAGWHTVYAKLSAFDVREGDCVGPLATIGKSGATGLASGPKLHFEVHRNAQPIDPLSVPPRDHPPSTGPR